MLAEQRSPLFPSNEPSIDLQREDVVFDENFVNGGPRQIRHVMGPEDNI